ncbi:hypothetical protein PsYK624_149050 [Phanerochaete sordida]|uniref:DUF6534 domain-containing protein n=1 Tax=Phanerochaete sordida TaxID=48140 RepID=A0A9P3GSH9_9APHY|nr:hypothetical protein PsYK624_149050 [Phanerochaete sordida]
MSSAVASPNVDYGPLAAPLLMGTLFNWGLYGILSVQVYLYHISFPRDRWTTKGLVYFIYVIDTVQTCLVTRDVFNGYAKHYGNLDVLDSIQTEWLAVPVFSSIVSCTVQMYYAHRIGILSGSQILRGLVCVLALTAGVSGVVAGSQAFRVPRFSELEGTASISVGIWLAGDAACDIIIAVLMAYFLLRHDSKISQTHAIVQRLIRLVIETGTLTAMAASIDVVLYYAFPHKAFHSCPATILAKLYSNSMLAIFNSRIRIVGSRDWSGTGDVISMDTHPRGATAGSVGPIVFTRATRTEISTLGAGKSSAGGIHVEREVWTEGDGADSKDPSGSIKKPRDLAAVV